MITFTIPYPENKKAKSEWNRRYGLNAYYSGKPYYVRKKDADELHKLTYYCLKKDHIRKELFTGPVQVRFLWDDGLDIDNHAVIGKAVVDTLKGYLIPDDNRKWVKKVSHEFWDGGCIKVEVEEIR